MKMTREEEEIRLSRRRLLRGDLSGARAPRRPPWALGEARFVAACTRCDDCVRACPEAILRRGSGGFPEVDFARAGCTFCGECVRVCRPGALSGQEPDEAWPWRARVSGDCLSQRGVVCRACGDGCEARAIRFRLQTGGRARIELDTTLCNGCGACLSVCPTGAIVLESPPGD